MKTIIISLLRTFGMLEFADRIRFRFNSFSHRRSNRQFRKENPGVALPPPFILYESFGKLDYPAYYYGGKESAKYIVSLLGKHVSLTNARICEWGCGPARLLRHFPSLLSELHPSLYGADYNRQTIAWCQRYIRGIDFRSNRLMPPTDYPDAFFDAVYCISVFTHLSAEAQDAWLQECLRIIKPGGVFLLSVHGDACSGNLSEQEKREYAGSGRVIRGEVTEGQRTYTSYNSPTFMRDVFLKGLDVAEYIPGDNHAQDIWIIKKQAEDREQKAKGEK